MKETSEQIKQALFILECKDHWTEADWRENDRLTYELNQIDPPKPAAKQDWYELVTIFNDGSQYREDRYFTSIEQGNTWAESHGYKNYKLVKC